MFKSLPMIVQILTTINVSPHYVKTSTDISLFVYVCVCVCVCVCVALAHAPQNFATFLRDQRVGNSKRQY